MKHYTDQEVLKWVESQETLFKSLSRGFGYEAIQARLKLNEIKKLTPEEKMKFGRLNLKTIRKERLYLDQLPK
jgi:hypothetical protein